MRTIRSISGVPRWSRAWTQRSYVSAWRGSVSLSESLSLPLSVSTCLPLSPCVCLWLCVSESFSVSFPLCLPVSLPLNLSVCLCLSVSLFPRWAHFLLFTSQTTATVPGSSMHKAIPIELLGITRRTFKYWVTDGPWPHRAHRNVDVTSAGPPTRGWSQLANHSPTMRRDGAPWRDTGCAGKPGDRRQPPCFREFYLITLRYFHDNLEEQLSLMLSPWKHTNALVIRVWKRK